MEENNLDLSKILENCKINDESAKSEEIISLVDALRLQYPHTVLVKIYNEILSKCTNPDVLMFTIRESDKYRSQTSLDVLEDLLLMKEKVDREAFINVRVMCAKALANLKNTKSVVPLLYCLNNRAENYKVRLACADALGKIGDKYAVAPLIDLVSNEDEKSIYLRESAASALGMLGDRRAIEPLIGILEGKKGIWDKFTFLKERVIEALSKLSVGDDKVFNALRGSLLDESPQIRINAIEALMNSGDERAVRLIKTCLSDEDDEVKKNATIALYNILGREFLDEIIQSPDYSEFLKLEAQNLLDEYEENDE